LIVRRFLTFVLALFVAVALASVGLAGSSPSAITAVSGTVSPPASAFLPTSFWNTPISATQALSPDSAALVASFNYQWKHYYNTIGINTSSFSAPVYIAPPGTPTVKVSLTHCGNRTYDGTLPAQFAAVPIPANARPASGTDNSMVVYQPSTQTEWEMWKAVHNPDGSWGACWGGKLNLAIPQQQSFGTQYGAQATGFPLLAGMIHPEEVQALGQINHVLHVGIPLTKRALPICPAQRGDGWTFDPNAITEGQRFRLDPTINVDALVGLTPLGYMIAHALQNYGMIVSDTSGAVDFRGDDPAPWTDAGLANPWTAIFAGKPSYAQLVGIPLDKLQALTAPC
jgi:hypothetical protein